jgi:hypothetical protein
MCEKIKIRKVLNGLFIYLHLEYLDSIFTDILNTKTVLGILQYYGPFRSHPHFAYRGFRRQGIQWKKSQFSETNGSRGIWVQSQWIPVDVMLKILCIF